VAVEAAWAVVVAWGAAAAWAEVVVWAAAAWGAAAGAKDKQTADGGRSYEKKIKHHEFV
jgi:hypothetical protein